jgi:hypothetical protein
MMFGIQKPAAQMTISALAFASVPRKLETATMIKTLNHRLCIGDRLRQTWWMEHPPANYESKEIVLKGAFKTWSSRMTIVHLEYFYTSTT